MRTISPTAKVVALFSALAVAGALFLALVGIDALEGRSAFQFYADSQTYHEVANGDLLLFDSWLGAVGIAGNFLGPLAVLRLTGDNYYLVMLVNVVLIAGSVLLIARTLHLNAFRYALLLLANPVVLSSLLSVNKEAIGIAALACLLSAYHRKSAALWIAAVVLSFLVRWQMSVFVLTLAALVAPGNPIRRHRYWTLSVMLVLLSIVYVGLADVFEPIRINFEDAAKDYEGSGFYEWLVAMQEAGYYWLVFPLKTAHLLFGLGLHFERLIAPNDIYNDVIQLLHSTALLVLFIVLLRKRRFRMESDLIYASMIYLVVFVLSPIYTPRYFLPVYVLWAAALCSGPRSAALFVAALPRRVRRRRGRALPLPVPAGSQP